MVSPTKTHASTGSAKIARNDEARHHVRTIRRHRLRHAIRAELLRSCADLGHHRTVLRGRRHAAARRPPGQIHLVSDGGPSSYSTAALREAHAHLQINDPTFDEMIGLFRATLEESKIAEADVEAIIADLNAHRGYIVQGRAKH